MERIHDHAIIGDGRSAALVSRRGSIDWLCWPRFDSPSVFGAVLDDEAGRWTVAPASPFRSERRYLADTNVLETRFVTPSGTMVLTDFMPVASDEERRRLLLPDHAILRIATCERGEVEVETVFEPRPDYGRERPRLRDAGKLGVRVETRAGLLTLLAGLALRIEEERGRAAGRILLRAGDECQLSLTLASEWPTILQPLGVPSREALERTIRWWSGWAAQLRYQGPARDAVVRSALALRLLVYAPSGAVVAAPTTSLPERVGGDLNWDYRYCWLRDAALTIRALFGLGFRDEADAFVSWLLHSTRLTQPKLRVLYDVHGNQPSPERTLPHLAGHRGSRPVRIGNGAAGQLQLDVYGEVIDAVAHFVRSGGTLDRETQRMLCAFGEYVCRNWQRPDEGIWEPRSGTGHNTHSRVLCWTALDRLLELHRKGHIGRAPVDHFERNRAAIRSEVEERAWNPELRSYASRLGGAELDAALLLIPWYGYEDAGSARMRATYRRIRERLGARDGLLFRYRSGDSQGEGAFGICSFWGAEVLALGAGSAGEAQATFERLCGFANDVGLFAEEIDPESGEGIGNFPQAFTHVGLINAALSLEQRIRGEEPLSREIGETREAAEVRR
ncbi:glycoside hydrolase family 15 protein [Anaeromyxobacter oryzisoli]|uniref:glycoside hydrolase family 15 protein n=1 Tax=Anaeromyxobacter oryzisoli TaxID=2925408 RepID=UPI001F5AA477|nr:glycoside hydrolase family 15 protein [Anaeromyxobacter sp. SG63]